MSSFIDKIHLMKEANQKLGIFDDMNVERNRNLILVYVPPKVGSTSLVSSLRLFANDKYTVLHIHNEIMLKVLYQIYEVSVLEIIEYNKHLGKNVFVIDIYRSPIEQKISAFFETIHTFHFNTSLEKLNTYPIEKIIKRFNSVFSHLANHDYYREKYELGEVEPFPVHNKYLLKEKNGVKYIKLRLKDSHEWWGFLNGLFQIDMRVVKDYETESKPVRDLYQRFKEHYRIPVNLLEEIKNNDALKFYYNEEERQEYIYLWERKRTHEYCRSYTVEEFALYNEVSVENQSFNETHRDHYIDMGCFCQACCAKRRKLAERVIRGEKIEEKIIHEEAKIELVKEKVQQIKNQIPAMMAKAKKVKDMRNRNNPRSILGKSLAMF